MAKNTALNDILNPGKRDKKPRATGKHVNPSNSVKMNKALNSSRKELEVDINLIKENPENDSSIDQSEITKVKSSMLEVGYQVQPGEALEEKDGTYTLISGHLRLMASRELVAEGYKQFSKMRLMIRDFDEDNDLGIDENIYKNYRAVSSNIHRKDKAKDTLWKLHGFTDNYYAFRKLYADADENRKEELRNEPRATTFWQTDKDGNVKPGHFRKLRSYLALHLGLGETTIGRIQRIDKNLIESLKPYYSSDKIGGMTAVELAALPATEQEQISVRLIPILEDSDEPLAPFEWNELKTQLFREQTIPGNAQSAKLMADDDVFTSEPLYEEESMSGAELDPQETGPEADVETVKINEPIKPTARNKQRAEADNAVVTISDERDNMYRTFTPALKEEVEQYLDIDTSKIVRLKVRDYNQLKACLKDIKKKHEKLEGMIETYADYQ